MLQIQTMLPFYDSIIWPLMYFLAMGAIWRENMMWVRCEVGCNVLRIFFLGVWILNIFCTSFDLTVEMEWISHLKRTRNEYFGRRLILFPTPQSISLKAQFGSSQGGTISKHSPIMMDHDRSNARSFTVFLVTDTLLNISFPGILLKK